MSEAEGKSLLNKIVVIVVAGVLLNVIIGGFWTWKLSYKNSLVNEWQEMAIEQNKKDIKENKALFYSINDKLTKLETFIKQD